ncbi:DEAD/DEAH box helicase [Actinomyces dentalis]|uniref:DEAD/DEAH box helicase n=1 Tax=Actinomyces dentalis TaxID=272548 RepID=UPI00040448D3|nr:DEAD/DEAH box helicase [Actinomyces dentalis]
MPHPSPTTHNQRALLMTLLLPSLQAERIWRSIVDYLSTTFALTDAEPRRVLADFLQDEEQGVFIGPFVRLRLPYLAASAHAVGPGRAGQPGQPGPAAGPVQPAQHARPSRSAPVTNPAALTDRPLDWDPGLAPYQHQEDAYRRLTTKGGHRPEPTIVTTGTGSGKTEAFLHPVLDHVLRARARGVTGVKALILYPMNALAADQAGRLARLIASDPALAGVRAAVYTGDSSARPNKRVTAESLITDRHAIRNDPPDILLTNYKMLDQLLLRPEDRELWRGSAASLTYLVLDEFHTYDGAQGTDVAMLLRRLGLTLRAHLSADDPRREAFADSPLGPVCPVATSATLGDGGDPSRMLAFARDVFGVDLSADAVVTETRADLDRWAAAHRVAAESLGLIGRALRLRSLPGENLRALAHLAQAGSPDPEELLRGVVARLYDLPDGLEDSLDAAGLACALQAHPDVLDLVRAAEISTPLAGLARDLLGPACEPGPARRVLCAILAALSVVRAGLDGAPDRSAVNVEVTLWIREVTRVDRVLSSLPAFRWADAASEQARVDDPARPALYCRSCGRSGWGVVLAPTGQREKDDQSQVRRDRKTGDPRFRTLLHAPGEDADYRRRLEAGEPDPQARHPGLRWYSVNGRELLARRPADDDPEAKEGLVLPVLTLTGDERAIAEDSTRDVCPSCGDRDSIRFLGSAVATLLSVSLTTLFGDDALDDADKRALIFTDSVQDAAHRAGFVNQRSHTMSLRSALRGALTADMPLDAWAGAALDAARPSAFDRYRLVPAALTEHRCFKPYWDPKASASERRRAEPHVRRRLLFDIALEVGLQSAYGRTLEATGSVGVHVAAGRASVLTDLARRALGGERQGVLDGFEGVADADLLAWVRGTLERMRRDGAIDHEWLARYKRDDGKRLWIWYKRNRSQGQPAFPAGRAAPAFPRAGGGLDTRKSAFVPVGSPRSWYATWTRKCLGAAPTHAARLARVLLARLAEAGILTATDTSSGGTVYGLPAGRVVVSPLGETTGDDLLLVCDTCRTQLPAAAATVDQLDNAPCPAVGCPGRLRAGPRPAESFYRSMYAGAHVRRVDAHEHTSLLTADERARVENGFKRPEQAPGDPNVLVATPTLEMGIDIGDLSTVMLGSLPATVASYVQRVGRAGRRSGSALALAYVPGRRHQLPVLDDPDRLLNGSVAPPSTYLGAEEILRRQFLASVIDALARENHPAVPSGGRGTAGAALGATGEGSLMSVLCERIERDGAPLVRAFTDAFGQRTPALERLTSWVTRDGGAGPREMLMRATAEHRAEAERLRRQERQIVGALPELAMAAERPNATEEDRRAHRAAEGARKAAQARILDLQGEHWVSALERHGILPNYTLIDDSVRLSARVSWRDPETDEFHPEPYDVERASVRALHEFAPGATFYTRGLEMRIEGVDASADLADQAQWWFCCEACGYADVRGPQGSRPAAPPECPRCRGTAIADVGRARRVLRLTRVFADVSGDDARIGDSSDDRIRTRFEILPLADFDPERAVRQWSVEASGFGLTRYRGMSLRWLNTGRALAGQSVDRVAGLPVSSRDFRLCEACGKLDTDTGASTAREHRPWCAHRTDPAEHVIAVDLMRELRTEAIAFVLPLGFATDWVGADSLTAAIRLGLEITTGGSPDHLGIAVVPHPVAGGAPGETRPALLLHDTVPGGTGYLTDHDDPAKLWNLLVRTGQHLEDCPCRTENRGMCPDCLQPHALSGEVTRAAALHAIRQLLGPDAEGPFADLAPEAPLWHVTDEAVRAGTGESPLEVRFRAELIDRLGKEMAVRAVGDPSGAPALEIDGGRWRIRPQLDALGARPDFTCLRPAGRAPIAVFIDGRRYHATRAHNRLADDAAKRERLRAAGYRVIAVGAEDLGGPWNPTWLDDDAVARLKNGSLGPARAGAVTDRAIAAWRGGPMALLESMLLDDADDGPDASPEATALSALADSIWGPLICDAARRLPPSGAASPPYSPAQGASAPVHYSPAARAQADPLWEALRALRPDEDLPKLVGAGAGVEPTGAGVGARARVSGSVFTSPHLALAVRLTGVSTTGMALMLDDSDEALTSPDHAEAWLAWLRLGNVLALAQAPVAITTTSRALDELRGRAKTRALAADAGVSPEAMSDLGWNDVDAELTPPDVLALLPRLAAAGIPRGDDGAEVADGVMTDLSWQDRRVAVVADPMEGDVEALAAAGWRVVVPGDDPEQTIARIAALLEGH